MNNSKVYILFSHPSEEADYFIICVTTDVNQVLKECKDFELDLEFEEDKGEVLTIELINSKKYIDFGYMDGERYVLETLETTIPSNREMYAVLANGNEIYFWEAALKGLFPTKNEAVNSIILEISRDDNDEYKENDEYDIEQCRKMLTEYDRATDMDFTYWNIIKVKVE